MTAKRLDAFAKAVRAKAKQADSAGLVAGLGALVSKRLKPKPVRTTTFMESTPASPKIPARYVGSRSTPKSRGRSRGKIQRYVSMGKYVDARGGTWRRYMLNLIMKHNNTLSAETEHAACDNPKFAKNRLDFGWANAEGYIKFI